MIRILIVTFFVCFSIKTYSQESADESMLAYNVGIFGNITSGGTVPFWLRTNNFGSRPLEGASVATIGSLYKNYRAISDTAKWYESKFDWSAGAQIRINAGNKVQFQAIEAFAKLKYSIFEMVVGRRKDHMGLSDTVLSSGAFAVSGNALGIPGITFSIPKFWDFPLTKGLLAFNGSFTLGYFGNTELQNSTFLHAKEVNSYYHQKSLVGRFGKPKWKIQFFGSINHQVMFGNEKKVLGNDFNLSVLKELWYISTGKAYKNGSILSSKIGNHIGSVDQAINIDLNKISIYAYHQFFYDVGGLYHLNNIKDGLWGVSVVSKNGKINKVFRWKRFVCEFLNSKSQGGELNAKITPSGDENYYNNYVYAYGWSYNKENIGSNFLTNKTYQKRDLPQYAGEYYGNNRVMLIHLASNFLVKEWDFITKFSFSRNYGSYATSPIGTSLGNTHWVRPPPYFPTVNQFSGYVSATRPLKNNFQIGLALAGDYGGLLYNSVGGTISLIKRW